MPPIKSKKHKKSCNLYYLDGIQISSTHYEACFSS
jgi:hypothetical protein